MIVTGFVDLSRYDIGRERRASEYHERARWLIDASVPQLVFCDELMRPGLWGRQDPALFEPKDVEAATRALTSGRQSIHWNKAKDTGAYLCLMRHKIEWMLRATRTIGARCYWWLDYGYRNLLDDNPADLLKREPAPGTIRIAELSYVPRSVRESRETFYRQHWWPVGGGVMAARAEEIGWLRDRIAEEWDWALANEYAVTDEMMIGWIRYQHPERFEIYYADHPTLVSNYLVTRGSHDLIRLMAERALQDGDYAECEARLLSIGKPWPSVMPSKTST
jgi:hypothetical protein